MASQFEDIPTLLKRATDLFQARFGSTKTPTCCVFAPGRVNLIGDHVDYCGGFVLPMALPMVTVAVGSHNDLPICRIETDSKAADEPRYVEFEAPASASSPIQPGTPKWANYVKGVAACFHETVKGFDAVIVSSVPVGSGLSSSAAVEVAVYTLLEELYGSPAKSLKDKALACQKAEHQFANVPCGIMDQFVSAMAKKGSIFLLDCKSMEGTHAPLDDPDICILIIDSGVKHQLSGSEYPLRRSQCEKAAAMLQVDYLRDVNKEDLDAHKDALGEEVYRRALHVVNETEYTLDFVDFLQKKLYTEAGRCMLNSHNSLSVLFNVSCDELDSLVEIASKTDGVYGARMTGGGFGGCAVALVEKAKVEGAIDSIKQNCLEKGLRPAFYVCEPCDGAGRLQ